MNQMGLLVIDSQVASRNMVRASLRTLAIDIDEASTIREAIEATDLRAPRVILFDTSIGHNVLEDFADRISQLDIPPVLCLTGDDQLALLTAYHSVSFARHYICKPYEPYILYMAVKGLLEGVNLPAETEKLSFSEHIRRLVMLRNREAVMEKEPNAHDYEQLAREYEALNLPKEAHRLWQKTIALESGRPYGVKPSLSGIIVEHRLESIFQFLHVQKLTGLLFVEGEVSDIYRVYFSRGNILDALHAHQHGYECLKQCVALPNGRFSFYEMPITGDDRLGQSTDALLLDLAIERDHAKEKTTDILPHLKLLQAHG